MMEMNATTTSTGLGQPQQAGQQQHQQRPPLGTSPSSRRQLQQQQPQSNEAADPAAPVVGTAPPTRRRRAVSSSKSMPANYKSGSAVSRDEAVAQSQRLLRVLLGASASAANGDNNNNNNNNNSSSSSKTASSVTHSQIPINKANVDRALQKYAQLLRQVQACTGPQQQLVIAQQQRQRIVEQQHRIQQLEGALERQTTIHTTALEIKAVELDIAARERDQKQLQVQQLQWKLAKERTAARDRAANHAAAVAASSSLTNRAELAEQTVGQQQTQIESLETLLEKTVAALRGKDRVLKQLLLERSAVAAVRPCCALCQPDVNDVGIAPSQSQTTTTTTTTMQHEEEEPTTTKAAAAAQEAIAKLQQESANLHRRLEQEQRCADEEPLLLSTGNNSREMPLLRSASMRSAASSVTPVVGHLSSSSFNYQLDDDDDDNDDETAPASKPPVSVMVEQPPTVVETITNKMNTTAEQQQEVESLRTQLSRAKDALQTLQEEKTSKEEDMEETIEERDERIQQLKNVLVACNERRKAAEQILQKHGMLQDESRDASTFAKITQKHPEALIEEIVLAEIAARLERSSSISLEVQRLQQALTETQQQKAETEQELAQLESVGRGAMDKIIALEQSLANAQAKLEQAEAQNALLQRECAEELQETREALSEAEVTIEILKQCIENKQQTNIHKKALLKIVATTEDASTQRTEATEPDTDFGISDGDVSSDKSRFPQRANKATGSQLRPVTEQSTANEIRPEVVPVSELNFVKPLQLNEDATGFVKAHELQQTRSEVGELRKRLTGLETNLAVANGKLVFMREMVLSVAPAARRSKSLGE